MELVSIYLPTHNRRALLERAVASVLSQTYPNIELLVVNDGSTDDTSVFLEAISKADPRVRYFNNVQPMGPSPSRNIAVNAAKGLFISGLDDDDEFTTDRISRFVELWTELAQTPSPPVCLFAQSTFVKNGFKTLSSDRKDHVTFRDLFQHNYIGNQVFCPRDKLIEAGLFDENLNAWEDLDLFLRVLRLGEARLLDVSTYLCDVSTDRDRISRNEPRIRRAFEQISAKYRELPAAAHQQLYLQMFSDYHGIRPTAKDYKRFLGWGLDLRGSVKLARSSLKGWHTG